MNLLKRALWFLWLGVFLFVPMEVGGQALLARALPGSQMALPAAVSQAVVIAVATMEEEGEPAFNSAGVASYSGAKIKIKSVLKGVASGSWKVSFDVCYIPHHIEEDAPSVGQEYIFFIALSQAGGKSVIKVLPSDKATMDLVTSAIANASKPDHP